MNIGAGHPVAGSERELEALVFFFVLVACGFALWRVWRGEHTYGY